MGVDRQATRGRPGASLDEDIYVSRAREVLMTGGRKEGNIEREERERKSHHTVSDETRTGSRRGTEGHKHK